MLTIYNSLTQQKEIFKPIQPDKIKMYVCGPTVYDYCHLGNARTYAAFDVIIRYLRFKKYEVTYVRNITDIDDKIIQRANENKEDFYKVVERFTQAMHDDFNALGLLSPHHEPTATGSISPIISLIQKLLANQSAYIASNGDVYYSVRHFKSYGCLSHRDIEKLKSGARVEINDVKHDPLDFVLWKLAKSGEPSWESPWGKGRPGWHIECSAMAMGLLGEQFDIHGGGKDLIFPHHENEMAQSEAVTQKKFVNIWMHAGYLQLEKEKMSKSLGNFFTLREILEKYPAEVVRYFLIASHYRSSLQYSENLLQQAHQALARFYTALRNLPIVDYLRNTLFEEKFRMAMDDDFNTPIAFSVLFELTHEIQRLKEKEEIQAAAQHGALLRYLGNILGCLQSNPDHFLQAEEKTDKIKIEELIIARHQARANKEWKKADQIRDQLTAMGVILEDGQNGTTWRKLVC